MREITVPFSAVYLAQSTYLIWTTSYMVFMKYSGSVSFGKLASNLLSAGTSWPVCELWQQRSRCCQCSTCLCSKCWTALLLCDSYGPFYSMTCLSTGCGSRICLVLMTALSFNRCVVGKSVTCLSAGCGSKVCLVFVTALSFNGCVVGKSVTCF